jgi:hypothetical protein
MTRNSPCHAAALVALLLAAGWSAPTSCASDLVEVLPLTKEIVMLHFDDGSVQHHKHGEPRSQAKVIADPLDVKKAALPATYKIVSRTMRLTKMPNRQPMSDAKPKEPISLVCR